MNRRGSIIFYTCIFLFLILSAQEIFIELLILGRYGKVRKTRIPVLMEICSLVCQEKTMPCKFRINVKPDGICFCLYSHKLPIKKNTIYFTESEDLRLKSFLVGGRHLTGIWFTGDSRYNGPSLLLWCLKVWYVLRKFSVGKQKSTLESIILTVHKGFSFWKYYIGLIEGVINNLIDEMNSSLYT